VPAPPHRQPARPRHGKPGRKAAHCGRAIAVFGDTQYARGVEFVVADTGSADEVSRRILMGLQRQQLLALVGSIAPGKTRVRVEYLQPAEEHQCQCDDVDPVHDPDRQGMPVDQLPRWCQRFRHRRRYRRIQVGDSYAFCIHGHTVRRSKWNRSATKLVYSRFPVAMTPLRSSSGKH
jgi:hypothetical protein